MKILIFEYITGGGFCNNPLPNELAKEGSLMLNALLDDLAMIAEHELLVMLDPRCKIQSSTEVQIISLNQYDDVLVVFKQALQACDAVWLIAPETAGILLELTELVEKSGRLLLSSPASAVAKTADKFQTFQILTKQAIPTVATQLLSTYNGLFLQEKVIKPRDGVSCEECFFIQNNTEMNQILAQILRPQSYIVQPYISGETLSISALFKHGMAQLICVNRQQVELKQQSFKLMGCEVNIEANKVRLQILLKQIARAFPDLWGYVGIDLIKQHQQFLVLEINPRLTTSYVGIKQALGINTAQAVLQLVNGQAYLNPTCNQTVTVAIAEENSDVI